METKSKSLTVFMVSFEDGLFQVKGRNRNLNLLSTGGVVIYNINLSKRLIECYNRNHRYLQVCSLKFGN